MKSIVQHDEWEMAERAAIKLARTAIRAKYSVLADEELNRRLPEVQSTVRAAVAEGRPWNLDVANLFDDQGPAIQ